MKKIMNVDWINEIREFNESGLSYRAWCATNKKAYSPSTLRRRIAEYMENTTTDAGTINTSSESLTKSTEDKVADVISSTRNQLIMHISNFNAKELELLLCYAEKILATKEMTSIQKRLEELNYRIRDGYLS